MIRKIKWLFQAHKFAVVGCFSAGIDYMVYRTLTSAFIGLDPELAKAISFMAGSINSFLGHKSFTFKSTKKIRTTLVNYYALYIISLGVNVITHSEMLEYLTKTGIPFAETLAFLIAAGFSVVINFLGLKFIVFKSPKHSNANKNDKYIS